MNRQILILLFPLLAGCATYKIEAPIPNEWDLSSALAELKVERGVKSAPSKALECPAPSPLPEVSYRVGSVQAAGEIRLPVYLDAGGRRSQGGVLFLEYDAKHMQFVDVEPGPAWDNADFVHSTVNDMVEGHAIFILLGWELTADGFAYGIPPSEEPWAFLVFEAKQPGKSKVAWDTLPTPLDCFVTQGIQYCFFRRGEMLVDLDENGRCVWDVIDFYSRNGVNTTGNLTVDPGAVKVMPSETVE